MDEKLFELMSKMYAKMQEGFARTDQKFASLENKMDDNLKHFTIMRSSKDLRH